MSHQVQQRHWCIRTGITQSYYNSYCSDYQAWAYPWSLFLLKDCIQSVTRSYKLLSIKHILNLSPSLHFFSYSGPIALITLRASLFSLPFMPHVFFLLCGWFLFKMSVPFKCVPILLRIKSELTTFTAVYDLTPASLSHLSSHLCLPPFTQASVMLAFFQSWTN